MRFTTLRPPQGTEHAVPVALEYGIANRLALLVEPVLVTLIRPEAPPNATGLGDLELTLQVLARGEGRLMPALALAAEEKLPTATNRQIGTGRADFTPYLIASKHIGRNEVHANVGYSFMGKPAGLSVQNTINLALAIERQMTPRLGVVAEVLSTSAAAGADGGESSVNAPEIAGRTGGDGRHSLQTRTACLVLDRRHVRQHTGRAASTRHHTGIALTPADERHTTQVRRALLTEVVQQVPFASLRKGSPHTHGAIRVHPGNPHSVLGPGETVPTRDHKLSIVCLGHRSPYRRKTIRVIRGIRDSWLGYRGPSSSAARGLRDPFPFRFRSTRSC